MMKSRKGQAALEFLTTYGWAIMALIVMIGALSYFGLLDPTTIIPERCSFSPNIICNDHQITTNGNDQVKLDLRHNFGETVYLENVNCTFPSESTGNYTLTGNDRKWSPRRAKKPVCSVNNGSLVKNEKQKVDILLSYRQDKNGFLHTMDGEVVARVR